MNHYGIDFNSMINKANQTDNHYISKVNFFVKLLNEHQKILKAEVTTQEFRFCRISIKLRGNEEILIQVVKRYRVNEIESIRDVTPRL